jgi:hypothetical protein
MKEDLNKELSHIIEAWEKAAKHYRVTAEKQVRPYSQGLRDGRAYTLESCAETLKELMRNEP